MQSILAPPARFILRHPFCPEAVRTIHQSAGGQLHSGTGAHRSQGCRAHLSCSSTAALVSSSSRVPRFSARRAHREVFLCFRVSRSCIQAATQVPQGERRCLRSLVSTSATDVAVTTEGAPAGPVHQPAANLAAGTLNPARLATPGADRALPAPHPAQQLTAATHLGPLKLSVLPELDDVLPILPALLPGTGSLALLCLLQLPPVTAWWEGGGWGFRGATWKTQQRRRRGARGCMRNACSTCAHVGRGGSKLDGQTDRPQGGYSLLLIFFSRTNHHTSSPPPSPAAPPHLPPPPPTHSLLLIFFSRLALASW